MLAKKYRLNLKESRHRELFVSGFRWRQGFLQAWYDFRGELPQVAVIAPKALLPQAAGRNALRRQCFSSLPADWLKISQLRLIVRAAHQRATGLTRAELKEWFKQLFAEISKHTKGHD